MATPSYTDALHYEIGKIENIVGSTASVSFLSPFRGKFNSILYRIDGELTSADNTITVTVDGIVQSRADLIIEDGTTSGKIVSKTVSLDGRDNAVNVNPGSVIEISTDGAGAGTVRLSFVAEIERYI